MSFLMLLREWVPVLLFPSTPCFFFLAPKWIIGLFFFLFLPTLLLYKLIVVAWAEERLFIYLFFPKGMTEWSKYRIGCLCRSQVPLYWGSGTLGGTRAVEKVQALHRGIITYERKVTDLYHSPRKQLVFLWESSYSPLRLWRLGVMVDPITVLTHLFLHGKNRAPSPYGTVLAKWLTLANRIEMVMTCHIGMEASN